MEDVEIFLNRLSSEEAVYAELSAKLGTDISDCKALTDCLLLADDPRHIALYISSENVENSAADDVVKIFTACAAKNKKLSFSVTEDEFLAILDEEGRLTGESKPIRLIHRDGDLHLAVHVWIIRRKDMGVYALLQKRSEDKMIHPGCYDVSVAGHVDQEEEFRTTAVRETMEELGVAIHGSKLEFLKVHRASYQKGDIRDNEFRAIYICREEIDTESLVLESTEVTDTCWVELDELLSVIDDISFDHCLDRTELFLLKKALF